MAIRSTSIVVAFTIGVSVLFALVSVSLIERYERDRLEALVTELAATVESTVSIACFVADRALAAEVARGLLKNRSIAAVSIHAGQTLLVDLRRPGFVSQHREAIREVTVLISSPFNPKEIVGEMTLTPAVDVISASASAYARLLGIILALQAAFIAAVVATVVLRTFVRPIKRISDDLHALRVEDGQHLALPPGNERNEFGRLTLDVNALIDRLGRLLKSEREQVGSLERSERRLRLIFDNVESGMFVVDPACRLLDWNAALARELGLESPLGSEGAAPRLDLLLEPHGEHIRALVDRAGAHIQAVTADFEIQIVGQRAPKWLNVLLQSIEPDRFHGMIQDVTARKLAESAALALAARDALTGLLNRRGMEHILDQLFARAGATDSSPPIAIMMLDLDWFKEVNDTHGHEGGDDVLRVVARRLQISVRPSDTVSRWGGDEFVLLLGEKTDAASTTIFAHRLIERLSEPVTLSNGSVARIGASIGLAVVGGSVNTREGLLHAADAAMYIAKKHGRGNVQWSSPLPLFSAETQV